MLYKRAEVNAVQPLDQIAKDCIEDIINGGSKSVTSDGMDEAVGSPRFVHRGVLCP